MPLPVGGYIRALPRDRVVVHNTRYSEPLSHVSNLRVKRVGLVNEIVQLGSVCVLDTEFVSRGSIWWRTVGRLRRASISKGPIVLVGIDPLLAKLLAIS